MTLEVGYQNRVVGTDLHRADLTRARSRPAEVIDGSSISWSESWWSLSAKTGSESATWPPGTVIVNSFFNIFGSFYNYGYLGFLFCANLLLIISAYAELLPPSWDRFETTGASIPRRPSSKRHAASMKIQQCGMWHQWHPYTPMFNNTSGHHRRPRRGISGFETVVKEDERNDVVDKSLPTGRIGSKWERP